MSLVTYNNELRIVLCDPKRDLLILHDSSINEFQLIQLSSENQFKNSQLIADINLHTRNAYEKGSDSGIICPNCGFKLDIQDNKNNNNKRDRSNSITNAHLARYSNNGTGGIYGEDNIGQTHEVNSHLVNTNETIDSNLLVPALPSYDGVPKDSSSKGFSDHVDHNYFKLLSIATQSNTLKNDDNSTENEDYEVLPNDLFTQGYFNKFFKTIKLIGRGSNAAVYKVEHFIRDFSLGLFALKKIPIGNDSKGLNKILKEVELLCILSSKNNNLVKYNHVWLEVSKVGDFGPEIPCAFILTEYCDGGNLEELINGLITNDMDDIKYKIEQRRKRGKSRSVGSLDYEAENQKTRLSLLEILKFFKDITSGVLALHNNHIIHRDLKPSNCLLSTKYISQKKSVSHHDNYHTRVEAFNSLPKVLISDFGESQFEGLSRSSTGATGTLEFVAPELLQFKRTSIFGPKILNDFTKHSDMFGLGMILFFICFGRLPYQNIDAWEDSDYSSLKQQISNFDINKYLKSASFQTKVKRDDLPEEIYSLLKKLLNRVPGERVLANEVLMQLDELISATLNIDYNGINEKLLHKQISNEYLEYDSDQDEISTSILNCDSSVESKSSLIPFNTSSHHIQTTFDKSLVEFLFLHDSIYYFISFKFVAATLQYKIIVLFFSHYYYKDLIIDENYSSLMLWKYKLLLVNIFLLGASVPITSVKIQIYLISSIFLIDIISLIYKYSFI